jgi:HprK-related kinase B
MRLEAFAAELSAAHPRAAELWLDLGGVVVVARSSSAALVASLARYFRDAVCPPAPHADIDVHLIETSTPLLPEALLMALQDWPREGGKLGPKERYVDTSDGRVVAKVRTGMFFLLSANTRMAVGPCIENLNQVVNFVIAQYIGWRLDEGWSLCHAASVSLGPEGLAIAARSGAGKSTLALHLMSSGLSFTSNDRLLIRRAGERCEACGVPKMPRVNPGTLLHNPRLRALLPPARRVALEALPPRELWRLEDKHDVPVRDVFGAGRTRYRVPLRALVVLSWSVDAASPPRFDRIDLGARPDLLDRVMKPAGVFHRDGDLDPGPYLRALGDVLVYEATGRADFDVGVAFCRRLLEP